MGPDWYLWGGAGALDPVAIQPKGEPYVAIADANDRRHEARGLAAGTQATYIDAVRKLAVHYRRSPAQLSEEAVRSYLLDLRE